MAFTIAVAANFYQPLISLATNYANTQGYQITICEDSSGNLYNAIVPSNSPQYALFFSADTSNPAKINTNYHALVASGPANYANGIPVFLLSPNAYSATGGSYRAVNYMHTGLPAGSGAAAQQSDPSLPAISNYVKFKRSPSYPAVSYLAIGDPSLAPYGLIAADILGNDPTDYPNNMNLWNNGGSAVNAGTNVTSDCSTLVGSGQWMCEYSNIDLTLQSIANNHVTGGVVGYSQVCPVWAGTTYHLDQYVMFPSYNTTQAYVQLTVNDTTAQSDATAFLSWLGIGTANWNTWLSNNCYQSL
ncbi:substrate-binding domain-containing protein [Trinickia dinghuensis]|uniref:substrate-binding domain-containing protein n=1 Tax=Trinickia dinghuensis TaxID=2291023 RepID=UPI0015F190C7|nr:substrate-binding domain-containing protein [Trinickia dinghuensis]